MEPDFNMLCFGMLDRVIDNADSTVIVNEDRSVQKGCTIV